MLTRRSEGKKELDGYYGNYREIYLDSPEACILSQMDEKLSE
jgi:hypothetical protein